MTKELREIFDKLDAKTKEAKKLSDAGEFDKANAVIDEVEKLQNEFDVKKKLEDKEKALVAMSGAAHTPEEKSKSEKFAEFVKSVVAKKSVEVPSESVDENGGYTVPEDIQTQVNKWPETHFSFLNEIGVVNVSTNKGARTYQKKTDVTPFADLDENGAITGQIEPPKFERVTYTIQDRAGFLPVSNDLIADSTANILGIISDWLGKAETKTCNNKVLEIINAQDATDFKNIKGITKAVNVTLGQAYKAGVKIYTNDDGLQYLSELDDKNGRPLLNPDPTAPAQLQLRCGVNVIPVVVIPNDVLESTGTKVPFIVGDLKAAICKWDRQSISIDGSSVASIGGFNAFEKNMTIIRAICRDDYTLLDGDAFVRGTIDTSASTATTTA
jgi:HK97 family phage major capsid protein